MRIVIDEDGERMEIDVEDRCTDGHRDCFSLAPTEGFGGTDLYLSFTGHITWPDLDKIKIAVDLAEKRWRK